MNVEKGLLVDQAGGWVTHVRVHKQRSIWGACRLALSTETRKVNEIKSNQYCSILKLIKLIY